MYPSVLVVLASIFGLSLSDAAHANRTLAAASTVAGHELVFYRERNATHSVLDVRVERRGRNTWSRLTELRPQRGQRATWPVVTTELGPGCQGERPTARTRRPRGGGSVRSPRSIYCLLPRYTGATESRTTDRVILASLGAEIDTIQGSTLPENVALQVTGGAGPDLIGGGNGDDALCAGVTAIPSDDTGHASGCTTAPGDSADEFQTDVVFGGPGNDKLLGDGLPNALHGGEGSDTIEAGEGDDLLIGDQGNDELNGHGGKDQLDTNWAEGVPGEQGSIWTVGSDTIDGGNDEDVVGYQHMTQSISATGTTATTPTSPRDSYSNVEILYLSKADDVFTSPPSKNFVVHGLAGNDNIDVSGDPSRNYNQRAYCEEGIDHVSIDVNYIPDGPAGPTIPPGSEIMEDGSNGCESTTYRAAR